MKHLLLILFLIASVGYSDSKSDTTIVPKKAGGSVIIQTNKTPRMTVNNAGAITVTGALTASGGIVGKTDGPVSTGYVGEQIIYITGIPKTLSTVSGTYENIFTYSLPPGSWDVFGVIQWGMTALNVGSGYAFVGISTQSQWYDDFAYRQSTTNFQVAGGGSASASTWIRRFDITTATTIYFVHCAFFNSTSALSAVAGTQLVIKRVR